MKFKKVISLAITTLVLNAVFIVEASAESIRLRCETRTARSKISVDGRSLSKNMTYKAQVTSGGVTVLSKLPMKRPVGGEVEFDFDSDGGDIRAGATAIKAGFIKKNHVTASIVDRDGYKVTDSEACTAKKK